MAFFVKKRFALSTSLLFPFLSCVPPGDSSFSPSSSSLSLSLSVLLVILFTFLFLARNFGFFFACGLVGDSLSLGSRARGGYAVDAGGSQLPWAWHVWAHRGLRQPQAMKTRCTGPTVCCLECWSDACTKLLAPQNQQDLWSYFFLFLFLTFAFPPIVMHVSPIYIS